ncbi:hypothetical protein GIB67_039757, partial [Kingdonia uniflora]
EYGEDGNGHVRGFSGHINKTSVRVTTPLRKVIEREKSKNNQFTDEGFVFFFLHFLCFSGFWAEEVVLRFWEQVIGLVEVFVVVVVCCRVGAIAVACGVEGDCPVDCWFAVCCLSDVQKSRDKSIAIRPCRDGSTMGWFYYAIHPLRDGSTIGLYRRRQPATTTMQERKGNDDQLPHNYPGIERQGQPTTTTTQEQKKARESTISFWSDHVEQPLLSIRDKLFETFRKRHKGVMKLEEVQLAQNSLHEMLLAFTQLPNTSGNVRGCYKQIQKLKLDTETVMLELNQILKANEINFAMLAALPAFFLSLILLMFVRTWLKGDKRAQGKGRLARLHRRLLVIEVEERIMQFQTFLDRGLVDDAQCMFGLVFYNLDRLYRAVERHAKTIGELPNLRRDIINLGKPRLQTAYKLTVTSRMQHLTRDSPPTDGVRGRNYIMKDMYGGTVVYESILLSGVAPEEFYRVIIDEVIRDDVQLFMEGGTLGDISSDETIVWYKSLICFG